MTFNGRIIIIIFMLCFAFFICTYDNNSMFCSFTHSLTHSLFLNGLILSFFLLFILIYLLSYEKKNTTHSLTLFFPRLCRHVYYISFQKWFYSLTAEEVRIIWQVLLPSVVCLIFMKRFWLYSIEQHSFPFLFFFTSIVSQHTVIDANSI